MKINSLNVFLKTLLVTLICVFGVSGIAKADVSPGDRIDKTNWQKIQGMVPESVLEYVKKGDFILDIGTLTVPIEDFLSTSEKKMVKANVGRYAISDKGEIVDAKTGKVVFVEEIPFPKIDPADPKAAIKILYNSQYERFRVPYPLFDTVINFVSRSGLERAVKGKYQSLYFTGYPPSKTLPNPNGYQIKNILAITAPYDVQGTAVMLWRYQDTRPDNNYSYIPAIRRVRRMSPASRSDAFLGSDMSLDDTAAYDGKITDFKWRLIGTQDAVFPFLSEAPQEWRPDPASGNLYLTEAVKGIIYGFEKPGWTGAPWAPTNVVWVKEKAYVVEGFPKDPYYNYGKTILWFNAARSIAAYKIIDDRAMQHWKTGIDPIVQFADTTDTATSFGWAATIIVDDRTDHATVSMQTGPRVTLRWILLNNVSQDDFTLGGFQKFCK